MNIMENVPKNKNKTKTNIDSCNCLSITSVVIMCLLRL